MIAWVSRHGAVVVQAVKDCTVKTVQPMANLAVPAGSRLYTDSARSERALMGYVHAFVKHTPQKEAHGEGHANQAECLFSVRKPSLRVFRGLSNSNLPGSLGFFQFLWNFRYQNACEQAERILQAADPAMASGARRGHW